MADKAWKACERRAAKYIGGERVPITGRSRGSAPDIEHNWLSVEVKYRKSLPQWIHDAMDQAVASKRQRQVPIVILCEKGRPISEGYGIFLLKDIKERWL